MNMNCNNIYFVSGIDTDAGKSYCTAWLANQWAAQGHTVITQKLIQTGIIPLDIDLLKFDNRILKPEDMKKNYVRRALQSLSR